MAIFANYKAWHIRMRDDIDKKDNLTDAQKKEFKNTLDGILYEGIIPGILELTNDARMKNLMHTSIAKVLYYMPFNGL